MFDGVIRRLRVRQERNAPLLLAAGLLIAISIAIRVYFLNFASADYTQFVSIWIQTLQAKGFGAFKTAFYDYNPPYLYVLYIFRDLFWGASLWTEKVISLLFDVSLSLAVGMVVWQLRRQIGLAILGAAIAFTLPEVILNGGIWGQVDAGYTMLIVWAIWYLSRNRSLPAWVIFGCALAFKSQAIFVLPAFILLFFLQKHRWWHVLAGVAAFFVWYIPALLAGRSLLSLLLIYVKQTGTGMQLSAGAPNMYTFVGGIPFEAARTGGLILTAVLVLAAAILIYRRQRTRLVTVGTVLKIFLLFALLVPSILPQMHERYFYMAGILAVLVALVDRRFALVAVLVQVANTLACFDLFTNPSNQQGPKLDYNQWSFLQYPASGLEIMALVCCTVLLLMPAKPMPLIRPKANQYLPLGQTSRN